MVFVAVFSRRQSTQSNDQIYSNIKAFDGADLINQDGLVKKKVFEFFMKCNKITIRLTKNIERHYMWAVINYAA